MTWLDAVRAREEAATQGPIDITRLEAWTGEMRDGEQVRIMWTVNEASPGEPWAADAEFYEHARSDVPRLLELVSALESALRAVETWHADDCPWKRPETDRRKHRRWDRCPAEDDPAEDGDPCEGCAGWGLECGAIWVRR